MQKIIPDAAIRGVLDGGNAVAEWLADTDDIIRDAEVSAIFQLKRKNLNLLDKLANEVHNWAIGIATVEGGVTGATGIFGLAADIPAIITLALRTIHKIGLCYGFEAKNEMDNQFVFSILSASGANSVAEKAAALSMLRSVEITIAKQTWKAMAEKAAQQQISKEGAIIAIKDLAKQLGINLTKRKALQAIPAVGALIGSSVNGWYVKDVGLAARRAFQERWLVDNQKIIDI
ncbi:MAG: EcsC family protein [Desulfobacteraceae bacterium]